MNKRVLFVDDEPMILKGFQRRLQNQFIMDTASSGERGLELIETRGPYAVVVSDMQMPGMNGLEFLKKLTDLAPATIRIMLTGNSDQATATNAVNQGHIFQFLTKPCSKDSLNYALNSALEKYQNDTEDKALLTSALQEVQGLSEELSHQASHDPLTGFINRQHFEQHLRKILDSMRGEEEYVLCYLDLDHFKVVNEACGRVGGDELVRQMARLIKKHLRKRDTIARIGGDEFAILLEHCAIEEAAHVADMLCRTIGEYQFVYDTQKFNTSVSMGLITVTAQNSSVEELLLSADLACTVAKEAGRNCVHISHSNDKNVARMRGELQWVNQITRGLEENRFRLFYQMIAPISNNKNDAGVHYEILIRFEDENGKIIPPGVFLPAAERYNLSIRLDRWVVHNTFQWLAHRLDHLERLQLCSINLSGFSLGDKEFLDFLIKQLRHASIPAQKICFEITETTAISNFDNALEIIQTLQNLGCHFALDDFGSGMSSFGYLRKLPVNFLKIDGQFVKRIDRDPIDFAMVKSIHDIGRAMGIKTIAEFVENQSILEKLREIGVDYAQGYGIHQPCSIEDLY